MVKLNDIIRELNGGGKLRYIWVIGEHDLVLADGTVKPVDGRSYHAFVCDGHAANYQRSETGSIDFKDLIIEWSK